MEQVNDTMVRRPPALLAPYVDSIIGYRMDGYHPGEHVGMPSRHLTFVISFDDQLELSLLPGSRRQFSRFDALLGGLHTSRVVIRHDGRQHGIILAVTPAGSRALFGLPAGALASDVVPLDVLWGRLAGELLDRLDAAPATWPQRFAVVEGVLLRALTARVDDPLRRQTGDRRGVAAPRDDGWRGRHRCTRCRGGWSRRHLTERFTAEYGVGPKQLARVLRFERSKAMLVRPGRPTLASIAAECGYADQAHMARDWRDIAGSSPTQWLADEQLPIVQDDELSPGG